jgi:ubiquinone/menaquinone biosynthesis C-methylase UbiE
MSTEMATPISVSTARPAAGAAPDSVRWLALGGVAGAGLFTLAWLVLGFLSPGFTIWGTRVAPYSPISAPISGLGLGPTGAYMNAAFVLSGLLILAGVAGLLAAIPELSTPARWVSGALLALCPVGAIVDGVFTLESGFLHFAGSLLGLAAPILAFPISGLILRRVPTWRRAGTWLITAGPLTLALLVLFFATFSPTVEGATRGVAGLTERLLATEVLGCYAALGWLAFRSAAGQDRRRLLLPEMEGVTARWYARQRGTPSQIAAWRKQAGQLTGGLPEGAAVLEVAPGPGYLAIEIARLGPFRVTGLDISRTMVQIAIEKARQAGVQVDFRLGDVAETPFTDGSFDLVVCQAAFKNFRRPVSALNEMHRVLREGGVAVIQDLRQDATEADIQREIDQQGLSGINALMTKRILGVLRGRAHSRAQFETLVAESSFGAAEFTDDGIGLEIRLRKA